MTIPTTISDYVRLLDEGVPFTQTNIGGDGEFLTIVGWGGTNSDGRTSTPEKAAALARVILEPRLTLHGWNPGKAGSEKLANAEAWLREHGVNVPVRSGSFRDPDYGKAAINVRWVNKEIIAGANCNGEMGPFIRALRRRALLVVGASWLTRDFLAGVLQADRAVPVHPDVGWDSLDRIEKAVRAELSVMPKDAVVSWGLGYLAKVLTWRLAPDYPEVTQIDVGACWDPYCGHLNRHTYKKPEWQEMKRRNLEGLV